MKFYDNPFNPDSYFLSFTLFYFVNQVLIKMHWEVSYTYGLMYQFILYIIFFFH